MRITFICERCKSKLVTRDAWAEWDEQAQSWVLGAAYDYAFCRSCERETSLSVLSLND